MFDLNIKKFLEVLLEVRAVKTRIASTFNDDERQENIDGETKIRLQKSFSDLGNAATVINAPLAAKAAYRTAETLSELEKVFTIDSAHKAIEDVESRLRDECEDITVLVLTKDQRGMFQSSADLIAGWSISEAFPEAARELEEASKCYALSRATAAVFHGMRMLEIGIKALSKALDIEEAEKPADKNWGKMLGKIKEKIDLNYPKSKRMPETTGAQYEAVYGSLDAVKNPWRNATMHVETFYQDTEARHILNNVVEFLKLLHQILVPLKPD